MVGKKTVVFELHVVVDEGDNLVARAQEVALKAVDFNAQGDFHLGEVPIRVYPDAEDEKLAKEFIESAPTDKEDAVEEKEMSYNPTVEEYNEAPDPEITPGPSQAVEDPNLPKEDSSAQH